MARHILDIGVQERRKVFILELVSSETERWLWQCGN